MNSSDLIQAGWALARPCLHLYEAQRNDPVVAILDQQFEFLAINCRYLPQNPHNLTGVLQLTRDWDASPQLIATYDPHGALNSQNSQGRPLTGRLAPSFPPLDALIQRPRIQAWLQAAGWLESEWRDFADDAYQAVFQAYCPLYDPTALATLGGWHSPWPDDDWDSLSSYPLLALTLYQAEPWFEVFQPSPTTFLTYERFT